MCYKQPGPRCSHHATLALQKAKAKYKKTPSDATYAALVQAQEAFFTTPAGFTVLQEEIDRNGDVMASFELDLRKAERRRALRALQVQEDEGTKVHYPTTFVNQALESSLQWDGEKPKWMDAYASEMENYEFPSTPELMDVFDSPQGKIAVVWEPHSFAEGDKYVQREKGMQVSQFVLKHFDTGEKLGRMVVSSISDESFARSYKDDELTPLRYRGGKGGMLSDLLEDEYINAPLDEQYRYAWRVGHRDLGKSIQHNGEWVAGHEITDEHIPQDMDRVKKDVHELASTVSVEMNHSRQYFKTPFVDYSSVDDSLKGLGIGSASYIYVARRLAKDGQCLRASGLQSADAEKTWESMKSRLSDRVKEITLVKNVKGDTQDCLTLDFR